MVEYRLEGLETPLALPDDHLNFEQWDRIERFILEHGEPETILEKFRCVGVMLGDQDLVDKLRHLKMNRANRQVVDAMHTQLAELVLSSGAVGDPLVDEVENPPLDATPSDES